MPVNRDLTDELRVHDDGAVRVVTLNRPELHNAVNEPLHRALAEVWLQLRADTEARVVVLTGAGRAFSAGGDMAWLSKLSEDAEARRRTIEEGRVIVNDMLDFPLPVVAAVNGPAVGLGCSLAVLCDIVMMDETSYLADPHVAIGLVAGDGGVASWPLLTSLLRAKEYLFTGDRISAKEAERLGLANRVAPQGTVLQEAMTFAHRLAELPSQALQHTKRALNLHLRRAASGIMEYALAAEANSMPSEEHREKVREFLARGAARGSHA